MINNKKKKEYMAPKMDVMKARVERGFTTSGTEPEVSPRYVMGNELGGRFN